MTDTPAKTQVTACCCIGPQNGEPLCPCMMRSRGLKQVNGRWIEPERDHGPVQAPIDPRAFLQHWETDQ